MSEKRPITVEVFRDINYKNVPLDEVVASIEQLKDLDVQLEVTRSSRSMRLSKTPDEEQIDVTKIRFPRLDTTLNVILTDSRLVDSSDPATLSENTLMGGNAWPRLDPRAPRVAVVSTLSSNLSITAQHETAHLLGLKRLGENFDGRAHCVIESCIMKSVGVVDPIYEVEQRHTLKERLLRRSPSTRERLVGVKSRREHFCDECARQLGQNAFFLQKFLAGERVLPSLIP